MAQLTQLLMVKDSALMNVHPDALGTYQADGWQVIGIRYSEGGEGLDTTSQVLMVSAFDSIRVRPGAVASYLAQGYRVEEILYDSAGLLIRNEGRNLVFLDTPSYASAEIGAVDATTLVVTFSTEVASDDFTAGVTIKVDDVAVVIDTATRQDDHKVVHYVIPEVAFGEVVTWEYDDLTGGIASEVDGTILDDVTAQTVTNNIPRNFIANGDFANTDGWSSMYDAILASIAGGVVNNRLRITLNGGAIGCASQQITLPANTHKDLTVWHINGTSMGLVTVSDTAGAWPGEIHVDANDAVWGKTTIDLYVPYANPFVNFWAIGEDGQTTYFDEAKVLDP